MAKNAGVAWVTYPTPCGLHLLKQSNYMKIISKFKDFYDFKVAKYGTDPILVFDRRARADLPAPKHLPAPTPEWTQKMGASVALSWLYVGNAKVALFNSGERVYSAFDVDNEASEPDNMRFHDGSEFPIAGCYDYLGDTDDFQVSDATQEHLRDRLRPYHDIPLLLACETDTPAIGGRGRMHRWETAYAANPQLSALGIYLDPDFVWQQIAAYLAQLKSETEARPQPMPNNLKIAGKGFDAKHSFRPKMKK